MDGLEDRENERTTEIEWLKLLTKYRDELLTCPYCGYEYIYGFEEKKKYEVCPSCGKQTKEVCVFTINKNKIVLEPEKQLYLCHLDKYTADYRTAVGKVIVNKNNPSLWGIKFELSGDLEIKDAGGNVKTIAGNGVVPIIRNLKIKFNENIMGEIK